MWQPRQQQGGVGFESGVFIKNICWGNFRNRAIREACNHSQIKLFRWFTRIIQSDTTLIFEKFEPVYVVLCEKMNQ
ncbi:hypothetical protein Hanom_Chr03g00270131 [Helianthus anomalus]